MPGKMGWIIGRPIERRNTAGILVIIGKQRRCFSLNREAVGPLLFLPILESSGEGEDR